MYVRINIRIASHFTQGTWRESQTSYPNFKSLHCRVKQRQVKQQNYFHVFSGFLQIFLRRKTLAFTQHFRLFQNLFETSDGLLSKLLNGVGNARIEIFTDIRIPSNNPEKKGKERKILTCDKVNYRMLHQFGVCGAFAWASFFLLPHADLFVQDTPRVHTVDLILKPSKAMCSLFRQVDEQGSDSDIPATCAVTVGDQALPEGSTSRRQSLFVPQEDSEESDESFSPDKESQVQLNRLLPENSQELWMELCDRHAVCSESQVMVEGRSEKETELLNAFAESYLNVQYWSTRRQLLSLMADKLSLKEMKEFIPTVTNYRYNIARRHRLIHGRAAPLPNQEKRRMRIEPVKLEHFVSFIASPRVVQDVPFGEKLLKLSTGEIIKTPDVIRTMIPERIVQQYQQYCSETNFEPMSKITLQRVLAVRSSSVRKSLQGLDNFSASGMEAVDALEKLVDKLVDCGKTQQ